MDGWNECLRSADQRESAADCYLVRLIYELAQVIDGQSTALATGQMIGDNLTLLAGQVSIDKSSGLFCSQVGASRVRRKDLGCLAKSSRSKGEECRIAVHRIFDPPSARFTVREMIGYGQQIRRTKLRPAVILNLILGKMLSQCL